jgi:hypothetical protein
MSEIKSKEGDVLGYYHDPDEKEPPCTYSCCTTQEVTLPHVLVTRKKNFSTPAVFRYPADREEMLKFGQDFFQGCLATANKKNQRYAGQTDPFKNFRLGGEYGIAVRMSDKVSRLLTLLDPRNTTDEDNESIDDTCADLANYSMLLAAMRANERGD